MLSLVAAPGCSSKQERARKAVEEFLQKKGAGVRDLKVDFFHPAEKNSSQAYIAVTVTYNFASSDGQFQKEYQGYVLKQEGLGWAIDHNAQYTEDAEYAETIIAGGK